MRRKPNLKIIYPPGEPLMRNPYISQYSKIGLESSIAAANPHKLILILYEGSIRLTLSAKQAVSAGKIPEKGQLISKIIRLIGELDDSINLEAGGEIATNLKALYGYICRRLVEANMKNDPEILDEISKLLYELKKAWAGITQEVNGSEKNITPGLKVAS